MKTLSTTRGSAFEKNDAEQRMLVSELRERLAATALGGPERSRERHVARGKLLPRERINELLDDGSPFLEIAPLAANGLYDDEVPAAGVIAGIGLVRLTSAPTSTPCTPFIVRALAKSMAVMRAWAWGERTIAACKVPGGMAASSANRPRPRSRAASSTRACRAPIWPVLAWVSGG